MGASGSPARTVRSRSARGTPPARGNPIIEPTTDGRTGSDLRMTYVAPSPQLLRVGRAHLTASLGHVTRRLVDAELLPGEVEQRLQNLSERPGDAPPPHLVGWAEFLIDYTNDGNATFRNRFRTEEYWYPFVHCLRGYWAGSPLTMTAACEAMRIGSHRTRETRIAIAEGRGMLEKRKSENDLRNTFILPTAALERALVGHFSRTLAQLLRLLGAVRDSISGPEAERPLPPSDEAIAHAQGVRPRSAVVGETDAREGRQVEAVGDVLLVRRVLHAE